MSEEAVKTAADEAPAESKPLTATQVFSKYMKAVEKARDMANSLLAETATVNNLATELASRFGIYVSGSRPVEVTQRKPATAPTPGPTMNEGEKTDFKPPAQYHSDAPTLDSAGSAEVAEIRRDAGLSEAAADSEALAVTGLGVMERLGASLPGTPSVVATPGEHHDRAAAQERSNAEGGPVRQGPVKKEE